MSIKEKIKKIKSSRENYNGINYSQYICENLDKNIKYTEYLSENLDKNISYSDYISENISNIFRFE